MSSNQIDYDELVQNALRGVVRDILDRTSKSGLPGDHHFYIAFRTRAAGVVLPQHLRERYPDEMTIVIQHKFWGLKVYHDRFEIGLSFNQKPEHLIIPFNAVVGFVDPSVQFALQFQDHDGEDEPTLAPEASNEKDGDAIPDSPPEGGPAEPEAAAPEDGDGDNVVTLDAFRKKH